MDSNSHLCAPHADQRRELADLLATQRAELPVQKVYFAFENQKPVTGATVTRVPRLWLPLEGKHPFELGIAHAQLVDEPLEAKDVGEGIWQGMCSFIRDHYDRPLDRELLAETFDVHPNHVSRLFSRYSKEGFNRFIARTRLEKATDLLRSSNLTIEEVALKSGFHDDNYFRYAFRRFFGMPPGQFRERGSERARSPSAADRSET